MSDESNCISTAVPAAIKTQKQQAVMAFMIVNGQFATKSHGTECVSCLYNATAYTKLQWVKFDKNTGERYDQGSRGSLTMLELF